MTRSICTAGRTTAGPAGESASGRRRNSSRRGRPVIVIDHQPRELQELANAGVDLDLCGHTHDGQTFPGNLTVCLFWENIKLGVFRKAPYFRKPLHPFRPRACHWHYKSHGHGKQPAFSAQNSPVSIYPVSPGRPRFPGK